MVKKFKHLNEDIVNQVVAHELECCWYQFLEGKKRLFSLRGWFSPGSILPEPIKQGPRLCYLCAEISFDESVQQEQFSGFYQYTKDTNMRDSDRTYFNYYAEEPRISGHTEDLAEDIGLNDWQTYFLLFVAGYLEWRPNSFPYFSESPDFNFLKYKNYAVTFIKRGKASKGEELDPFGFAAHTESYFAYVFPVNALPHICSVFKRGAVE